MKRFFMSLWFRIVEKIFAFGIFENLILYLPNISLVPSLKDSLYRLMFETCFRILFLSHFYIFLPRIIILHLHNFAQETALLLHGRKERGGKKRKFHYRSALSIYTHHSPRFTHEHGSVVAHSSLVTVTIDSLTRSRPLIRDAIDSREGENRAEGVRIREENSPPLFNQKIVDEDVKNFRVEIVRSLFLRNREPLFLVVFLRF